MARTAAKDLEAGNAMRAAERADVTAAMKIAEVARMQALRIIRAQKNTVSHWARPFRF